MDDSAVKGALLERGVVIDCPGGVLIGSDINPEQIASGVRIHNGCRLSGAETSLGPGCELGAEAPVTLDNCQLGKDVKLKGGFFQDAVFMEGVIFGSGAHVRGGTLLEEFSSCAHTVGLKQTVLMPYATLGSLINFCDCLLAGGTGSDNHSEVGSSYIHFNFTAHQDKATPSIAGNVPQGVMLDQAPVFLGGQGGLVGPTRLAFGTVLAAGMLCRRDVLTEGCLVFGGTGGRMKETSYDLRVYGDITRIVKNNLYYIGNLLALLAWYRYVRPVLMSGDAYSRASLTGGVRQIEAMLEERLKRLRQLAGKLELSLQVTGMTGNVTAMQQKFIDDLPQLESELRRRSTALPDAVGEHFIKELEKYAGSGSYVDAVKSLPQDIKSTGCNWLEGFCH